MLRTRNEQPTLWESILPEELLRLPAELAGVDALLDDEAFFAPFRAYFDPVFGRPSIPIETYLRLMFLKSATGWDTTRGGPRFPTRVRGGGAAGAPRGPGCPAHARPAGRRAGQTASNLRLRGAQAREEAQRMVRHATAALATLAAATAAAARAVLRNARRALTTATGQRA